MSKLYFPIAGASVVFLLAGACSRPPRQVDTTPARETQGQAAVLPPPSTVPRYSIATNDPDEISLLTQRLKLSQVTFARGTMYFAADEGQLRQLRALGYQVTQADPEAVDIRVLRVERRGSEENLRENGVIVVTREPTYWIVSGTLAQLRRLVAAGYRLENLAPGEPRPRRIQIVVTSRDDVQRVANMEVDIFSVADTSGRYTILGAALDMQLDRLRAAGFTPVILPTP